MKKISLIIFCSFVVLILFFGVFGGIMRNNLYVPVTTNKLKAYSIENDLRILRVVPNEAVHIDNGGTYVWVLSEDDDIGEKYFYAEKIFVEIVAQDDIYTGIRGVMDGTTVIVTSASELENGTRVKISGEYEK